MQAHQQRVVDEKAELDGRRDRLSAFILSDTFDTIPAAERARLVRQSAIMRMLSEVLGERIAAFEEAP